MCALRTLVDGLLGPCPSHLRSCDAPAKIQLTAKMKQTLCFFKKGKKGWCSPVPSKMGEGILLETVLMHMENMHL